jgi:gliding motility-associated lipoprotein GldH
VGDNFKYLKTFLSVKISIIILFSIALLTACDPKGFYEKNAPVDPEGWSISDKKPFEVEVTDTLALLNFYLNIRHTTEYKNRNIFLFLDTFLPDGMQTRDTIEIMLADAKGKWYGKGIGNIRSDQVLLKRGFSFPMKGLYKFRIEQGMREMELTGIKDVGIRIEKM